MLIELGQQLAAEHNPGRVLEKFCHAAREIIGATHAGVGMLNVHEPTRRYFFRSDLVAENGAKDNAPQAESRLLDTLLKERRPLRLSETDQSSGGDAHLSSSNGTRQSFLGAPIFSSAEVYGWLYLKDKIGGDEFSEADERLAARSHTGASP